MRCTIFNDLAARKKTDSNLKTGWFTKPPTAESKGELQLLKLATFGDKRKDEKGCLRWDGNVKSLTGAEIDYDAGEIPLHTATKLLEDAGINAILYTSPSCTEDSPRWRVLLPFFEEFTGTEPEMRLYRNAAVLHACGALGIEPTAESMKLSQAFYFGCVTPETYTCTIIQKNKYVDQLMDTSQVADARAPVAEEDAWAFKRERPPVAEVREILSYLDPDMDRQPWVDVGAALHHTFDGEEDGFEIFHEWSQAGYKYADEKDCRIRWDSWATNHSNALRFNSICAKAAENGADLGQIKRHHQGGDAPELDEEDEPARFDTFTWDDATGDGDPPRQLVEDFLLYSNSSLVSAQPNTGKSALALDLAICVAAGKPWNGKQVTQASVLYVAAESPGSIRTRILANRATNDPGSIPLQVVQERINLVGDSLAVFKKKVRQHKRDNPDLGLVIVDTFRSASAGVEENAVEAIGPIVTGLHGLAQSLDLHMMIVHHTTKAGGNYSGSGIFGAVVDTEVLIRDETDLLEDPDNRGCLVARVIQQRELGSKTDEYLYRIHGVPTGRTTNFQKPETAPVVTHIDSAELDFERGMRQEQEAAEELAGLEADLGIMLAAMEGGATSMAAVMAETGLPERRYRAVRQVGLDNGSIVRLGEGPRASYRAASTVQPDGSDSV